MTGAPLETETLYVTKLNVDPLKFTTFSLSWDWTEAAEKQIIKSNKTNKVFSPLDAHSSYLSRFLSIHFAKSPQPRPLNELALN